MLQQSTATSVKSARSALLNHAVREITKDIQRVTFRVQSEEVADARRMLVPGLRVTEFFNRHLDGWASAVVCAVQPFSRLLLNLLSANGNLVRNPIARTESILIEALKSEVEGAAVSDWLWLIVQDEFDSNELFRVIDEPTEFAAFLARRDYPKWLVGYLRPITYDVVQSDGFLDAYESSEIVTAMHSRFSARVKSGLNREIALEAVRLAGEEPKTKKLASRAGLRKKEPLVVRTVSDIVAGAPELGSLDICKRMDNAMERISKNRGRQQALTLAPRCKCRCESWVSAYQKHPKRIRTWISKNTLQRHTGD